MIALRASLLAAAIAGLFYAGSSAAAEVRAVPVVDLERYAGRWYEIARFPNRFQEKCISGVTAEYHRLPGGAIQVTNRCRQSDGTVSEAVGEARMMDLSGAKLEVRFAPAWLSWVPAVWADYWVLDLDPDYSVAAVGEPERKFLWILSRTPSLPEATYSEVLRRVAAQGYDVKRLQKTRQD